MMFILGQGLLGRKRKLLASLSPPQQHKKHDDDTGKSEDLETRLKRKDVLKPTAFQK